MHGATTSLPHPERLAPQARALEKHNRVGGVLQEDHPHRPPPRRVPVKFVALRHEVKEHSSRRRGSQTGLPAARVAVALRQVSLSQGGPTHSAP